MSLSPGEEFRSVAVPGPELLRKLAYLAEIGSDSVLSGHAQPRGGSTNNRTGRDAATDLAQMLEQQQARAARIAALNDRLAELDRRSAETLHRAQEHLDEVLRTANRTTDGRAVFQDADGTIYDEQGNVVDPSEIGPEGLNPDAPSWDDYRRADERVEEALRFRDEVKDHQERADGVLDNDELASLEADILALEQRAPSPDISAVSAATGRTTSAAKLLDDPSVTGPELTLQSPFAVAVVGTDDTFELPDAVTPTGPGFAPR